MRCAQTLGEEQIDNVFAALIDNRRHRLAVDIIEAAAEEPEALRREVDDRRRDVEFTVEPWLDRVLVARFHVYQMPSLERTYVGRHDFVGDGLLLIGAYHGRDKICGQRCG